jgi:plastocyanin
MHSSRPFTASPSIDPAQATRFVALRIPRFLAAFGLAVALIGAACNSSTPATGGSPAAGGSAPTGGSPAAGGSAVAIVDFAFNPGTLSVKAGSSVTWTNTGGTAHTVTADDGSFDSGTVNPSATFSHPFASAGTFTYHCAIHTNMKATITVTP